MGDVDDLKMRVRNLIDEMEDDTDHSRSQSFLEEFWELRRELEDARSTPDDEEKETISILLALLNRKGKEYDLEPY